MKRFTYLLLILVLFICSELFAFSLGPVSAVKKKYDEVKEEVHKERVEGGEEVGKLVFVTTIGSVGTGNGEFDFNSNTDGLRHDGTYLYVVDSGNNRIQKFDQSYNFVEWLGTIDGINYGLFTSGIPDSSFIIYGDIALDESSNIFVINNYNTLYKFDKYGVVKSSFVVDANSYSSMCLDSNNNLFAFKFSDTNTIAKYSSTGTLLSTFGGLGTAEGKFDAEGYTARMVIDSNDYLYISDVGNSRIQKFDNNGNFIRSWQINTLYAWHGLTIDENENIYLLCSMSLMKYTTSGTLLNTYTFSSTFGSAVGLAVRNNKVYINNSYENKIYVYEFPN
jgi:sugar lactone lactonase YvrE